jgi:hypothetical protein
MMFLMRSGVLAVSETQSVRRRVWSGCCGIMGWTLQVAERRKNIKSRAHSAIRVMKIAITLETIHSEIQQVRAELHRLLCILEDDGELTDEACHKLQKAREETSRTEYISHEEIMAKYGLLR